MELPPSFASLWIEPQMRLALAVSARDPQRALSLAQRIAQRDGQDLQSHRRAELVVGLALVRADQLLEAQLLFERIRAEPGTQPGSPEDLLCRWQLAALARRFRDQPDVVTMLERCVTDLEAAGFPLEAARCRLDLAAAHNWRGQYADSQRQIDLARGYFRPNGLTIDAAQGVFAESALHRFQGRMREARLLLEEGEIFFAAADLPVERATVWLYLGATDLAARQPARAQLELLRAEIAFEELGLPVRKSMARSERGSLAWQQGRLEEARHILEANVFDLQRLSLHGDLAVNLVNLANLYSSLAEPERALTLYQQARDSFAHIEDAWDCALCDLNQGECLGRMGRFGQALRALITAKRSYETLQAQALVASACDGLGQTWLDIGDPRQAQYWFLQAQELYRAVGANVAMAKVELALARLTAKSGHLVEALAALEQARATFRREHLSYESTVCDQIAGDLLRNAGQPAAALESLKAAEDAFHVMGYRIEALSCRINRAEAWLDHGDPIKAEQLLDMTADPITVALPDLLWRVATCRARAAELQFNGPRALRWYLKASDAISQMRRWLSHEVYAAPLIDRRASTLDRGVRLALSVGHVEAGLELVEDGRAQILLARLSARPSLATEDPALVEARHRLNEIRYQLSTPIDPSSSLTDFGGVADRAALFEQLEEAGREYLAAEAVAMPWIGSPAGSIPDWDLTLLRSELDLASPAGWSCAVYHWLGDELLCFVLDRDDIQPYPIHLTDFERTALRLCTSPEVDRRDMLYGARADGRSGRVYRRVLYERLLPPALRERLVPERLLVIVPAGPLHGLPFQALWDGEACLIEQTVLAYADSLTSLRLCLSRAQAIEAWPPDALIVALEDFAGQYASLTRAVEEAHRVRQHFVAAELLIGDDANSHAIAEAVQAHRFSAVHFATHAVFEAQAGRLSRLALKDRDWQCDEIERVPLATRLVSLSACQAGLGQFTQGEEITGLTRAFFVSGTAAVLASLWKVDDDLAPELMDDFYGAWADRGRGPAWALAQVQRRWILDQRPVLTWAGFGLYGAA